MIKSQMQEREKKIQERVRREDLRGKINEKRIQSQKLIMIKRAQEQIGAATGGLAQQSMMREFSAHFPEQVENYKIQYPIKDELIKIMPRLHHSEEFVTKPNLKKILIPAEQFESLITIWNFFNTFSEYLSLPKFKLEELEASLRWSGKDETKDDNSHETLGLLQLIFKRSVKQMTKDLVEKHYKLENKSKEEGSEVNERFELRVFHFIRR